MAQRRKMDCQVEIKSPADKFYDAFKSKTQQIPKMSNEVVTGVKLVQGDWESVGSVKQWSFVAGGKSMTAKVIVENRDDKNKTIVIRVVEGDMMDSYKSWKATLNVTPKGEGSLVKWTMEYEKLNESIPDPVIYADFYINCTKNLDAYLLSSK
ncbi:hypothetical protein PTKIN_Ptkin02bG0053300 [Pterospermum kingtungense]